VVVGSEDVGVAKSGGAAFLCTKAAEAALVRFGHMRHANVTSGA